MTQHYKIIKMYHNREQIKVDSCSLDRYLRGDSGKLEHILDTEDIQPDGTKQIRITLYPPNKPYKYYVRV